MPVKSERKVIKEFGGDVAQVSVTGDAAHSRTNTFRPKLKAEKNRADEKGISVAEKVLQKKKKKRQTTNTKTKNKATNKSQEGT